MMPKPINLRLVATAGLVVVLAAPLACDDATKSKAGTPAPEATAAKFDTDATKADATKADAKTPDAKTPDAKTPDAKTPDAKKLEPLPALDTALAAKAVAALSSAAADKQGMLAAAALAELELARLGASYCGGLSAMAEATADNRGVLVAQAVKDNMPMLELACEADAAKTMRSLATMDVTTRKSALWEACQFEKLGLMTKDDGAKADAVAVLLAHMAFARLQASGPVDPNERSLLESLAKIKDP